MGSNVERAGYAVPCPFAWVKICDIPKGGTTDDGNGEAAALLLLQGGAEGDAVAPVGSGLDQAWTLRVLPGVALSLQSLCGGCC